MVIVKPRMGRITQGTVFCAGVAEDYRGRPVWGLVITARCDTAHEKTPIVNYLPVVTIEDWLVAHGGILCLEKEDAEVRNRLRSLTPVLRSTLAEYTRRASMPALARVTKKAPA